MQEGLSVNKSGSKNNAQFSDADVVAREELVPRDAPTVIRVELLRQQITSAFTRSGVAGASLDDWEHTAIRYARATRDRPASILITDLSRDLEDLSHLLTRPLPVSAWRRLTLVAAQMSGLMCLTFCILDDRLAFRGWARTARLAGSEAGDPETLSWVLAQEAHGHYYGGDMLEAIDVARHAGEVARVPCAGAALGAALEARAQATLGRNDETRKALARAEDTLSHLSEEDALIPSAFGYNEASYRFHEGNAYTHLRDAKSAFKSQERALALCAPDNYTDWAMTRLDRAECLIYAGQAADGLRYGIETLTSLAQPKRMGIIARRAEAIMQALPLRARNMTAARDFGEQLMALVGTGKAGKPS
jgi:tetratricopeptide (TPR) repeat protein